ncbi:MAG: thiamine pyrophosphate-binding protein [Deltaproteobacteria bacterium]|nr:thiamine pyrophosphate-binding protein [Deltaproteobacteria bacterium]
MKSNAEIVVDALEKAGTRYVFGYPGGQNARFLEAMHGSKVEFVLVTQEACAGFMADIYGRLTGKPGACLSTLGPGATNMTTGVGNAFLDRVPLFAFTAKMGKFWKGRTVQMQIDHQKLYAPLTKWTAELKTGQIYGIMKKATEIALAEQPGPVHLDFPEDVAEELSGEDPAAFRPSPPAMPPYDETKLKKALELLRKAKRPLVAIGLTMNRAGATRELCEFVKKHRLPVVTTLMAKGHVPEEGSQLVGVVGRARRDIVAEYYKPADLVLAIGYDPVEFNYEDWVRKDLPLIHIDTVPADIAEGYALAGEVVGDIRSILQALLKADRIEHQWDLDALKAHRRKLHQALTPPQANFSPHHALLAMRELMPADSFLVADVGAHTHIIGQLWDPKGPGNFLVSNGWSSMGFGIPAAIAAKLLQPTRPVVACVGDGGFLMKVGEINTAVRLRLPVVFVVFRDRFLSLIKVKQSRKEYHRNGVEIFGPDFQPSEHFFGAKAFTAKGEEEFREALKKGLAANGPVVIEALLDPTEYDVII